MQKDIDNNVMTEEKEKGAGFMSYEELMEIRNLNGVTHPESGQESRNRHRVGYYCNDIL